MERNDDDVEKQERLSLTSGSAFNAHNERNYTSQGPETKVVKQSDPVRVSKQWSTESEVKGAGVGDTMSTTLLSCVTTAGDVNNTVTSQDVKDDIDEPRSDRISPEGVAAAWETISITPGLETNSTDLTLACPNNDTGKQTHS